MKKVMDVVDVADVMPLPVGIVPGYYGERFNSRLSLTRKIPFSAHEHNRR